MKTVRLVYPIIVAVTWILATPAIVMAGQQSALEVSSLTVPRVSRAPHLRDFLERSPREAEAVVEGFRQRKPQDGASASQRTTAYLSYDANHLYVVFVCEDESAESVRGHMAKREDIDDDDTVAVYLDTFHDKRHAYMFQVNPLGLQRDGLVTEGQKTDYNFDTVWQSEGQITENGYIVWMAIPFKSLRFLDAGQQTWGIALRRNLLRTNEDVFWPYITSRVSGMVNQMAVLHGIGGTAQGHNILLNPYGTLTASHLISENATGFTNRTEPQGGLDVKAIMNGALTLDLTANPDFAQVESDEPQVTVNQRYEVKYPEKRPFFMDNAGYFQTPLTLFYSRRVIDPEFGGRLTGKAGAWTVAGLVMDDLAEGNSLSADDSLFGRRTGLGAFRLQNEFGAESNIGVLVTTRNFAGDANSVAAADTRLRLSKNLFVTGQFAGSTTERQDKPSRRGTALIADLNYSGRNFFQTTTYTDISPDFRADLGYVKRVDLRTLSDYTGYYWYPNKPWLVSAGPSATAYANWDHDKQLQDWYIYPSLDITLPLQTSVGIARSEAYERYSETDFRPSATYLSFSTAPTRWISFFGSHIVGTGINYAPPDGIPPFLGGSLTTTVGVTWRPLKRLRFENAYIRSTLSVRDGTPVPLPIAVSRSVFENHIWRSKLNYQFTRELSIRAIVDYYSLLPNELLFNATQTKNATADLLLTYQLNPGTALHIGYTDRRENLLLDPTVPGGTRITNSLDITGRQFFVKLSYLFRP